MSSNTIPQNKPSYDYLHAFWTLHQTKEAYEKAVKEWENQVKLSTEEQAPYDDEEDDDDRTVRQEEEHNTDNLSGDNDDLSGEETNVLQQHDNLRQESIDTYLQKRRRDDDVDSLGEYVKQLRVNNESSSNMVIDEDEDM